MKARAADRYSVLRIADALVLNPGLRLQPSHDRSVSLVGELAFSIVGPNGILIGDRYDVAIHIPEIFPKDLATVFEVGKRIPDHFHKLSDGSLCMGSPTAIRLAIANEPTAVGLIELLVLPYLYGHSCLRETGKMPFGELEHGIPGIRRDFAKLFDVNDPSTARAFADLSALRRRVANKRACPCGSGYRFGRCHHLIGNRLRRTLGRGWLRQTSAHMMQSDKNLYSRDF